MHTRTYADPEIVKYRDKFVWVTVEPNKTEADRTTMEEISPKLEEMSIYLSFPTAVILDAEGRILKTAVGMHKPEEMKQLLDEALALAGGK